MRRSRRGGSGPDYMGQIDSVTGEPVSPAPAPTVLRMARHSYYHPDDSITNKYAMFLRDRARTEVAALTPEERARAAEVAAAVPDAKLAVRGPSTDIFSRAKRAVGLGGRRTRRRRGGDPPSRADRVKLLGSPAPAPAPAPSEPSAPTLSEEEKKALDAIEDEDFKETTLLQKLKKKYAVNAEELKKKFEALKGQVVKATLVLTILYILAKCPKEKRNEMKSAIAGIEPTGLKEDVNAIAKDASTATPSDKKAVAEFSLYALIKAFLKLDQATLEKMKSAVLAVAKPPPPPQAGGVNLPRFDSERASFDPTQVRRPSGPKPGAAAASEPMPPEPPGADESSLPSSSSSSQGNWSSSDTYTFGTILMFFLTNGFEVLGQVFWLLGAVLEGALSVFNGGTRRRGRTGRSTRRRRA